MVLEKDEIQELNRYMLGLGAPETRDNVGYNKPDFALMESLGRFLWNLDDDMTFAIAERLAHYKNTQLADIEDDLSETVAYYQELLEKKRPENYRNMYEMYQEKDFLPYEVHLVEKNITDSHGKNGCILEFDGKLFLPNINLPYWTEIYWQDTNYEKLFVPNNRLSDFMTRIKNEGKFGYAPDAELKKYIEEISKNQELVKNGDEDTMKIAGKTKDGSGYFIRFNGFADIKEFMDKENAITPDCLKWKRVKDNIVLYVKKEEIFYLYKKAKELGFYNHQLEEKSKNVQLKNDDERQKDASQKRDVKNKSDNRLVNWKKFDMPFTPYKFQIEDATQIVGQKRMMLGHDMGCGKTLIAGLVGTSINEPKLVIVPESLRLNWRKEIKNITPDADIRILYSKDKFDLEKGKLPDWTIVGYATVSKYAQQIKECGYQCIFIDEAHNCKAVNNYGKPASKRAEAVLDLCKDAEYVYPMTGTPIPTRNKDLYNIFRMLNVDQVGTVKMGEKWSFYNYGNHFCDGRNNGFGWECEGNSNSDELHACLQPYIVRRLKKDVLPDLKKQRVFIPTETSSREYKEVEKRLHHMEENDTYMGLAMKGRHILSKEKVKPAMDLADSLIEEGKSVVIVSNFNETLDTIVEKYGDECCTIRGGMSDKQKQAAIDDFQNKKKHICALNIIAGGVGVTLTAAHDMIICDYDWTPSNMSQVEDRICRAGQTEGCNIHYIYCENSVLDTTFVDMITRKSRNIDKVVDGSENTMDLEAGVSFMKALQSRCEADNLVRFTADILPKAVEKYSISESPGGYLLDGVFVTNEEIIECLNAKRDTTVLKRLDALVKEKEAEEHEEEQER